jgi:hypothetical protein
MTKHSLITLTAAGLASLALAAPASADTLLAPDAAAKNVATGGGVTAWATPEGDGFRLVVRTADGTVSTPDIPAFATAPDPTIGSTGQAAAGFGARRVLALYSREDDSGDSDIYALDPRTGTERAVPGLSSARYDETAAAMAYGRFAAVRSGGKVNGVVTGTVGRHGLRRISKSIATDLAFNGSRVAYASKQGVIVKRVSGQGRALRIGASNPTSLNLTRYQAAWIDQGELRYTQRFAGSGGPYRLVVKEAPRQPAGITSVAVGATTNDAVFTDGEGVKKANPRLFIA